MPELQLDPAFIGDVEIPGPPDALEREATEGRWPRMLALDEETEDRLSRYLSHEISLCWQERDLLVEDWKQWQKDYWAKPSSKVKNFPFKRAANVVIPMTAIAVEAIYARLINTLFSVEPFWSVRPRSEAWIKAAPKVEDWLQAEAEDINGLNVYDFSRESLLELIKLGTGIGKSGYERDIRKTNIDTPDGTSVDKYVEVRNGSTLDYVPVANFLLRLHEKDPQKSSWVGEEHTFTWTQLKKMALSGRMMPEGVEEIKSYWGDSGSESTAKEYDDARREEEDDEPAWHDEFNVQEIWAAFDVDGDGVDEEIVVDFHHASRTILSIRYNWYSDLHRPYRIGVFMPVEGRWTGIGVGKQSEQFQALITTVHRQRLDAGTLANMGQIALKKTSGYGPGEPIFPGKMWFLDDVSDIKEFQLSDTHHFQHIQNEEAARGYHDKRVGISELHLGIQTPGTPAPATSDLARLAEGNRKFDAVLKNVRRWYSLLGEDVIANYQQFGNQGKHWIVLGENGQFVEEFLRMPEESVRRGAVIDLTVTDSVTNKDVEQQKWQGLFAILTAHYDKVLERAMMMAQVTQNPQLLVQMAQMALRASNEATRRLLETFQVPDIDTFLLDLEAMQEDAQSPGTTGPEPGNGRGRQGAGDQTRILELAAAFGEGGAGIPEGGGRGF